MLFTEKQKKTLREYKYHGGDTSYIYKYVLSPLAENCVNFFTPRWVAPNLITLVGLFFPLATMVLQLIYNPNFDESCPRWLFLMSSAAMLIYQTLDNMDGKQARRIGASSPLGLLFDHGCDSMNTGISAINLAGMLTFGRSKTACFGLWTAMIPFYFATWEEYYVGAMFLPVINGPTEGILLAASMGIIPYFFGTDFWLQTVDLSCVGLGETFYVPLLQSAEEIASHSSTLKRHDFVILLSLASVISTCLGQFVKVLQFGHPDKIRVPVHKPVWDLIPLVITFVSATTWLHFSKVAFSQHLELSILLVTCVFVDMVVNIMIAHLANKPVPSLRITSIPLILLAVNAAKGGIYFDESSFIYFAAPMLSGWMLHFMMSVCLSFADALNIYVFKVGKKELIMTNDEPPTAGIKQH